MKPPIGLRRVLQQADSVQNRPIRAAGESQSWRSSYSPPVSSRRRPADEDPLLAGVAALVRTHRRAIARAMGIDGTEAVRAVREAYRGGRSGLRAGRDLGGTVGSTGCWRIETDAHSGGRRGVCGDAGLRVGIVHGDGIGVAVAPGVRRGQPQGEPGQDAMRAGAAPICVTRTAMTLQPIDRDTDCRLPPSVQEWLLESHLVRYVVDVVVGLDLSEMERKYAGCGSAAWRGT